MGNRKLGTAHAGDCYCDRTKMEVWICVDNNSEGFCFVLSQMETYPSIPNFPAKTGLSIHLSLRSILIYSTIPRLSNSGNKGDSYHSNTFLTQFKRTYLPPMQINFLFDYLNI